MSILDRLKAALGLDGADRKGGRGEPEVTVERTPSTETEDAIKGTESDDSPRSPRSAGASAEADEPANGVDGNGDPVVEITGIGPTYAERLEAAGIATVADLAAADPTEVAEAAQASESRAADWIEQAVGR